MTPEAIIHELKRPEAFPGAAHEVTVRQTHISAVFLVGNRAYKIKKQVRTPFLDYSTPEKRRHYCDEEVRLNRRLAPDIYLGTKPVTRVNEGLKIGGSGDPVDYCVVMKRLHDGDALSSKIRDGHGDDEFVRRLARRIARFHAASDRNDRISSFATFERVGRLARGNFEESRDQIDRTVDFGVFERFRQSTQTALDIWRDLIDDRAKRGMPVESHGDLRLEHVYDLPDAPEPVVIDCIEFSEALRFADPVCDMAFAAMDFKYHGRRDLAATFVEAYFEERKDDEGRRLVPIYTAYRAAVRAKVNGMKAMRKEVPEDARGRAGRAARAHWLLGTAELEGPMKRPGLVLVGGLPATGKSTLAKGLADAAGFTLIRSDAVRKELGADYSDEANRRVYRECRKRAETVLEQGGRAIVDATFRNGKRRDPFFILGCDLAVRTALLICRCPEKETRRRIRHREQGVSEADERVYDLHVREWEEPAPGPHIRSVPCEREPEAARDTALAVLRDVGLG